MNEQIQNFVYQELFCPQNISQVKYDNPGLESRNTDKSWRVSSHIFQIYCIVTLATCMLNSLFLRFRVLLS